jgi:deazaflavin-dependent oxidoreductase (nitroreductase family)
MGEPQAGSLIGGHRRPLLEHLFAVELRCAIPQVPAGQDGAVQQSIDAVRLHRSVTPRTFALLETAGRRSGLPRYTPVGNGLVGDTFWLVAAHGTQADYVRNLQADPKVWVKIGRQWRSGTAVVLPDDDPARPFAQVAPSVGRGVRATYCLGCPDHPR